MVELDQMKQELQKSISGSEGFTLTSQTKRGGLKN